MPRAKHRASTSSLGPHPHPGFATFSHKGEKAMEPGASTPYRGLIWGLGPESTELAVRVPSPLRGGEQLGSALLSRSRARVGVGFELVVWGDPPPSFATGLAALAALPAPQGERKPDR